MCRVRIAVALGFAATLVAAGGAEAQAPVTLTWRAPADCPGPGAVEGEVRRLLGLAPAERFEGTSVAAAGAVERLSTGRFALTLVVGGAERRLEGEHCEELAQAAALILALAVDPALVTAELPDRQPQPNLEGPADPGETAEAAESVEPDEVEEADQVEEPDEVEEVEEADEVEEAGEALEAPAAPESRREGADELGDPGAVPGAALELRVHAGLAFDALTLPSPALGLKVGTRLAWGRLRLGLGMLWLAEERELVDASGAGGDVWLAAAVLDGGYALTEGRLELVPFAAFEVGAIVGEGRGVSDPGRGRSAWLAIEFGLAARLQVVGWLALRAEVALLVPLHRPVFELEGVGPVHRPQAASARLAIMTQLAF